MSKKVITEADIEALARDGVVEVVRGMVVTPLAREYASRKGIRLVYGGGSVPSAEDIPRDPHSGAKGPVALPDEVARIAEEVSRALAGLSDVGERVLPADSLVRDERLRPSLEQALAREPARAVVVAAGVNRPGVAAAITSAISDCGGDIQDISQTIVSDFFSMILVVNIETLSPGLSFRAFKERIEAAGREVGAETAVFHEAILRAMHRV